MQAIKKTAMAVALASTMLGATAQSLSVRDLKRPEALPDFVEQAIAPALRVVKATYFVTDANMEEKFAYEQDSVFGFNYSLGVFTDKGFVIARSARCPWEDDQRFVDFKNDPDYQPLFHDMTMSRLVNPSDYVPVDGYLGENITPFPQGDVMAPFEVITEVGVDSLNSFRTVKPAASATGVMVWVVQSGKTDLAGNCDLDMKIESVTLSFDGKGVASVESPAGNVVGGIFMVAEKNQLPGTIVLNLAGFASPSGDRKWKVYAADLAPAIAPMAVTATVTSEVEIVEEESEPAIDIVDGDELNEDKGKGKGK